MKRLTFLLIFVASFGYSQSNLVFNRVLNFKLTSSQTATVPAGKVWKVENFTNQSGTVADQFYLDTSDADFGSPSITNGYIDGGVVWLKEGSDIRGYPSGTLFSILEFDVVPTSTGTGSGSGGGGVSSDGLIFSQLINEAIAVQQTTTPGTVLYSFDVPAGHIYKVIQLVNVNWLSIQFSNVVSVYISQNGEPINYEKPNMGNSSSTNTHNNYLFLKEGSYDIVYYTSYQGTSSGNRLYMQAIDYIIPQ
jgi:hypothetical protein